ncbi:unnamed protein product [Trichobilharzia szidati]|nr:unnamed protein product [Trichobilharzia szidati]
MVTVLDKSFHRSCFFCNECRKTFTPGMRVTFWSEKFFCKQCFQSAYDKESMAESNIDDLLSHNKNNRNKYSEEDDDKKVHKRENELETLPVICTDKNKSNLSSEFCRELTERLAAQYSATLEHVVDGSKPNEITSQKEDSITNTNDTKTCTAAAAAAATTTADDTLNIQEKDNQLNTIKIDNELLPSNNNINECIISTNTKNIPITSDNDDNTYCSLVQSITLDQQTMQIYPSKSHSPVPAKGRVAELVKVLEQVTFIEKDGVEHHEALVTLSKSKSLTQGEPQKANSQYTGILWNYEDKESLKKYPLTSKEFLVSKKYDTTGISNHPVPSASYSSPHSSFVPPKPPNLTEHLNKQSIRVWPPIRSNLPPTIKNINRCNYQPTPFINHTTPDAKITDTATTAITSDKRTKLHHLACSTSTSKDASHADDLNSISSSKMKRKSVKLYDSDELASKSSGRNTPRKRLHKKYVIKIFKTSKEQKCDLDTFMKKRIEKRKSSQQIKSCSLTSNSSIQKLSNTMKAYGSAKLRNGHRFICQYINFNSFFKLIYNLIIATFLVIGLLCLLLWLSDQHGDSSRNGNYTGSDILLSLFRYWTGQTDYKLQ